MPQAFTLVFLRYLRSCGSASLQLTARIHNWSKLGRKSTGSSVSTDWARSTVRSFFSQFFEVECWWGHFIRSDCQSPILLLTAVVLASLWGDAYTVPKWTRSLRTKNLGICTKGKNHLLYIPQSHDWAKYRNVVRKRCALFFHNTPVPSVIVCFMCCILS